MLTFRLESFMYEEQRAWRWSIWEGNENCVTTMDQELIGYFSATAALMEAEKEARRRGIL
jgi:hypothetical protein